MNAPKNTDKAAVSRSVRILRADFNAPVLMATSYRKMPWDAQVNYSLSLKPFDVIYICCYVY